MSQEAAEKRTVADLIYEIRKRTQADKIEWREFADSRGADYGFGLAAYLDADHSIYARLEMFHHRRDMGTRSAIDSPPHDFYEPSLIVRDAEGEIMVSVQAPDGDTTKRLHELATEIRASIARRSSVNIDRVIEKMPAL